MTASTYEVGFVEAIPEAPGVSTSRFERPAGYSFVAGQHLALTLPTREGPQTKTFTHSSSPEDPYIEITTRMTGSAFKDALKGLSPPVRVTIAGPNGKPPLPDGVNKVAFLVGGVGVTPARSIIRDAVQRSTGLDALVFYGNLDQDNIPFGDEFETYEAQGMGIRIVHVLMEPKPGWDGEVGFITADVVSRHTDVSEDRHWVVAGPPPMISAMREVVRRLGLPDERVSIESFAGYPSGEVAVQRPG